MSFGVKAPRDAEFDAWRAEQAAEWARHESAHAAEQMALKAARETRKDDLDRD